MHAASYTAVLRSIVDQGNIDGDGDDDDDDCGGGESGGGKDDDDVDGGGGGGGGGDEHTFTATHAGDETFEKFALVPRNMHLSAAAAAAADECMLLQEGLGTIVTPEALPREYWVHATNHAS